jgi:hypothetical protein
LKKIVKMLPDEKVEDEADFRIDRIHEKLVEARSHYMVIRGEGFSSKTATDQDAAYNSLYAALWSAYKDRLPSFGNSIGYDLSCIFAGENQFESQLNSFVKRYPELESFKSVIVNQRQNWQNNLRDNRNVQTHDGDQRNKPEIVNLNTPAQAKQYFALVCRAIESIGVTTLSYKIPESWNIVPVNEGASVFDRVHRYELRHAIQGLDSKPLFDNPYH